MKLKEFGPPGGGARPSRPPLDPPMYMVTAAKSKDFSNMKTQLNEQCKTASLLSRKNVAINN